MKEMTGDLFYSFLKSELPNLGLDYVPLSLENDPYRGLESHKEAIKDFMEIVRERRIALLCSIPPFEDAYIPEMECDEEQMIATQITATEFFQKENLEVEAAPEAEEDTICRRIPEHRSYWQAFYDEPYYTFTEEEFDKLNSCLFGEDLEIYRWNDQFSFHFARGQTWWGTGMWTVYDREKERMVVVGASLSD